MYAAVSPYQQMLCVADLSDIERVDCICTVKFRSKDKMSWMRYCVGKAGTEISSEESSEIIPANGADWMSTKAEVTCSST